MLTASLTIIGKLNGKQSEIYKKATTQTHTNFSYMYFEITEIFKTIPSLVSVIICISRYCTKLLICTAKNLWGKRVLMSTTITN